MRTQILKIFSILIIFNAFALEVRAADYIVTTDSDENDGSCTDGDCSLRDAIIMANTRSGTDTITFDADYTISLTLSGTGDKKGDLDIKDSLEIIGRGQDKTIIDGNQSDRVFDISGPITVIFSDMTLQNGYTNRAVNGTSNVYGGGIYLHGGVSSGSPTLHATRIVISGNTSDYDGGGIYCNRGQMNLDSIELLNNSNLKSDGGGIWLSQCDDSQITKSHFSANSAVSDGGGLYILRSENISVTHSLFDSNIASMNGGAINVEPFTPPGSTASLSLSNTTLANNTAVQGGGLYVIYDATVNIHSNTISRNLSTDTDVPGAGIFNAGTNSTINIKNSVVAGNTSVATGYADCNNNGNTSSPSYFYSYGANAIPSDNCNYEPTSTDMTGSFDELNLEDLADNGGDTQTMMIGTDSTAINTGDCSALMTDVIDELIDDQRGEARDSLCDIGAVETIPVWYPDSDGDGFGDSSGEPITTSEQPTGYVLDHTDCFDFDPYIFPNAEEICDGSDNNCDGQIDEGLEVTCVLEPKDDSTPMTKTTEDPEENPDPAVEVNSQEEVEDEKTEPELEQTDSQPEESIESNESNKSDESEVSAESEEIENKEEDKESDTNEKTASEKPESNGQDATSGKPQDDGGSDNTGTPSSDAGHLSLYGGQANGCSLNITQQQPHAMEMGLMLLTIVALAKIKNGLKS